MFLLYLNCCVSECLETGQQRFVDHACVELFGVVLWRAHIQGNGLVGFGFPSSEHFGLIVEQADVPAVVNQDDVLPLDLRCERPQDWAVASVVVGDDPTWIYPDGTRYVRFQIRQLVSERFIVGFDDVSSLAPWRTSPPNRRRKREERA